MQLYQDVEVNSKLTNSNSNAYNKILNYIKTILNKKLQHMEDYFTSFYHLKFKLYYEKFFTHQNKIFRFLDWFKP